MEETYLRQCLRDGRTIRWPDTTMPIRVYIAPFRWYEKKKQQESYQYQSLVLESLNAWSQASGGVVQFKVVNQLRESQIDVNWRRVDRRSLGHCEYMVNKNHLIYSAEVSIGLSDGLVHAKYDDIHEVRHTVLHEIGHALGLNHSPVANDIMYVPHQFGITALSERDCKTLKWLYRVPAGFNVEAIGKKHGLKSPFTVQQVLDVLSGKPASQDPSFQQGSGAANTETNDQTSASGLPNINAQDQQAESLREQHHILSQRGQYFLATQHVQISPELKQRFLLKGLGLPAPENPEKKPPSA